MHTNFYECEHSRTDLHRHERDLKANINLLCDSRVQGRWTATEHERASNTISNLRTQLVWVAGQLLVSPSA